MRNHPNQLKFYALGLLLLSALTACQVKPAPKFCSTHTEPFKYSVCSAANTKKNPLQLELIWRDPLSGEHFATFKKLSSAEQYQSRNIVFALNAGMYAEDYAPLALYVENGKQLKSLNQKKGGGNFHLLPNGVYWIDPEGVSHVNQTSEFNKIQKDQPIEFATQSGPMLVINGNLHPMFDPKSTSKKIRSGVGICSDKQVKFVISDVWVSFYEFAKLFKDELECDNALFLDGGTAPALMSSELRRSDIKQMGPMIIATTGR